MTKIWMDLKGYEGKYQVSNQGEVFSVLRNRVLKGGKNRDGYIKHILITPTGKRKTELSHRLIALMFCEKKDGHNIVNHLNSIKDDNRSSNLEWTTVSGNTSHAYKNNESFKRLVLNNSKTGAEKRKMKIRVYKNDKEIGTFDSQYECAEALSINRKTIFNAMRENRETRQGYRIIEVGDAKC